MAIVTGLAAVEPDPRAGDGDVLLDAALQAATGLAQLLRFRGACARAESVAEREAATACSANPSRVGFDAVVGDRLDPRRAGGAERADRRSGGPREIAASHRAPAARGR